MENVYNLKRAEGVSLDYIHVLVTPDSAACSKLQQKPGPAFTKVRCLHDEEVFGGRPSIDDVQALLRAKGPHSRSKGAFWYFQQYLKLGAIALGAGGLGEHVRLSDGETVTQRNTASWFSGNGSLVYRNCGDKGDGHNGERYGNLYHRATGKALYGSSHVVSHGQSVSRTLASSLIAALSPPNTSDAAPNAWVLHSLGLLCDEAAITGFSEYWYLFSHAVERYPANIKLAAGRACHRLEARWAGARAKCDRPTSHSEVDYVILEDHLSARHPGH